MSYLGLDIGTSSCKGVAFNDRGKVVASVHREYNLIYPGEGLAELDSSEVCLKCFEVIKEIALHTKYDRVRAMAVSSQGEAFTPVSEDGGILRNAMVSSDSRAVNFVEQFCSEFGAEKLYSITGHTAYPMFTLFKLLWYKQYQPDLWARTAKFLCFEDLIHLKLGLEPAIGYSLAGRTMLFNVLLHKWDDEILKAIDLQPSKLAKPLPSGTIIGTIPPAIALELGLTEEVAVITGGHDQTCAALGAGIVKEKTAMYATGTVECITPVFAKPVFNPELFKNNYCTYDYTLAGMYCTVAFSLSGGNVLKWFVDEFGEKEKSMAMKTGKNIYEILLESLPDKPSRLLVLPYFAPTGTPYFDSNIAGAIIGLHFHTSRHEIMRALLEGVAFEMRLNLAILEESGIFIEELRAVGGGAKSKVWTQLKANVLNKPVTNLEIVEAGCLGAAILARSATTGVSEIEIIEEWIKTSDTVYPQAEYVHHYDNQFKEYMKLYPAIKSLHYRENVL